MNHHCHANGCDTPTPPRLFMCPAHWRMVPITMQGAVWTAYRGAPKESRWRDRDYLAACAKAVEHVAALEGKPTTNSYRGILNLLDESPSQDTAEPKR